LTVIRSQNVNILHLNAAYTKSIIRGDIQMIAKVVNPLDTSWYIASKNRRKSSRTLPPFS
jgi:ABC-type hemin transport system substrate-binding protein